MRKEEEEGSEKNAVQPGEGRGPVRTVLGYSEGPRDSNHQHPGWCSGTHAPFPGNDCLSSGLPNLF